MVSDKVEVTMTVVDAIFKTTARRDVVSLILITTGISLLVLGVGIKTIPIKAATIM